MSRNPRSPSPSAVNPCRGGCGRDVLPTPVGVLEHVAHHLEWAAQHGKYPHPTQNDRREAWKAYATALERMTSDLRGDIATRDDIIESLTADYEHVLAEVKAANAEVSRLRDQACMAAHR